MTTYQRLAVWACTDQIGGDALCKSYREELVVIDPDAALEDDCFVVVQLVEGKPRL